VEAGALGLPAVATLMVAPEGQCYVQRGNSPAAAWNWAEVVEEVGGKKELCQGSDQHRDVGQETPLEE